MESRVKRNSTGPKQWLWECDRIIEFLECASATDLAVDPLATRYCWTHKATILETFGYRDRLPQLLDAIEVDGIFQLAGAIAGQPVRIELLSLQLWHLHKTLTLLREVLEILIFADRWSLFRRELPPNLLTLQSLKTGMAATLSGKFLPDLQACMHVQPSSSPASDPTELVPTQPVASSENVAPPASPKLAPVTLGALSLATSALFGASGYWLALNSNVLDEFNPFDRGRSTLAAADREYQTGNVRAAVRLAQSIAPESTVYPQAQSAIAQWKQDWQQARISFAAAEEAWHAQRWDEVIQQAELMPEIVAWQNKLEPLVTEARGHLEQQASQLLKEAYDRAMAREFTEALTVLEQIPQETETYRQVPAKIAEYRHKQKIRAHYFLQKAYRQAGDRNFTEAIAYLQEIPPGTPVSRQAKLKIAEYTKKQAIRVEYLSRQRVSKGRQSDRAFQRLRLSIDPGSFLQEINPRTANSYP